MRKNAETNGALTEDPLRQYLQEIAKYPLLTREGEIEVMKTYEHGVVGQTVIDSITEQPTQEMTNEEFAELGLVARIGNVAVLEGQEAKSTMVNSNLRLSVSIAKRYQNKRMLLLDLIQEGNIGLMSAVEKFEYRKGFKFSTYATWWVRQAVARAVANQETTIRTPVHMNDNIARLRKAERQLEASTGEIDDSLLSVELDISIEKLQEWRRYYRQNSPISLNEPIGDDGSAEFSDMIPDKDSDETYQRVGQQLDFEELWGSALREGVLNDQETEVIIDRFGLFGNEARTLEQIGKDFGVTRERIRQIEQRALSKLMKANLGFSLQDHVS